MDDKAEVDAREIEAEKNNLNYIGLDGSIGCFGKACSKHVTLICHITSLTYADTMYAGWTYSCVLLVSVQQICSV